MLDTNTCVVLLRQGHSSQVALKRAATTPDEVVLCSVVVVELLFGAYRSKQTAKTLAQVRAFASLFLSVPFDHSAADPYGQIRAHLANLGTPIGPSDLMIAAIARAHGLRLVTHNTAEFSRVPGLAIEDRQIP